MIDELAAAAGSTRTSSAAACWRTTRAGSRCWTKVASMSGWAAPCPRDARGWPCVDRSTAPSPRSSEISSPAAGQMRIHNAWCAIDCGRPVNPDSVAAQMEGGIVHGVSAALPGASHVHRGTRQRAQLDGYPMVRMGQMPNVSVAVMPMNPAVPIGGVGEPGVPPVAPALANAWAKLTGQRVRDPPFFPARAWWPVSAADTGRVVDAVARAARRRRRAPRWRPWCTCRARRCRRPGAHADPSRWLACRLDQRRLPDGDVVRKAWWATATTALRQAGRLRHHVRRRRGLGVRPRLQRRRARAARARRLAGDAGGARVLDARRVDRRPGAIATVVASDDASSSASATACCSRPRDGWMARSAASPFARSVATCACGARRGASHLLRLDGCDVFVEAASADGAGGVRRRTRRAARGRAREEPRLARHGRGPARGARPPRALSR